MIIQFSSKARTLAALSGKIQLAKIKPLVIFTVKDWHSNPSIWVKEIIAELGAGPLIVRSSSLNEDLEGNSNAGAFLSLINVKESSLVDSVDNVISSYGQENDDDEIKCP